MTRIYVAPESESVLSRRGGIKALSILTRRHLDAVERIIPVESGPPLCRYVVVYWQDGASNRQKACLPRSAALKAPTHYRKEGE